MSTVAVHDYDFFHYENVIPNLECAKLVAYYRNRKDITLLTPALEPSKYTKFFIRKEYNDGLFPKQMFEQNCEYGGRAFTPTQYKPLDPRIEATIPDMHIYDKYVDCFGRKKVEKLLIKRLLNCAHIRLAPDSQHILPMETLMKNFETKPTGIILHDYDLASLNPYDFLIELQNQRKFVTKEGINPYPIGNKFPIKINSPEQLDKWMKVFTIPYAFFLQYDGLMTDEILYKLCRDNVRMARQVYYNISYGCTSEQDFLINRLPKIFIQVLFLRKTEIKILLKYDNELIVTPELQKFIELLNCWLSFKWLENGMPLRQTLFEFCKTNSVLHYITFSFRNVSVTTEEQREVFYYVHEHNYELFKLFYEWDSVIFKGGKFINEWGRN